MEKNSKKRTERKIRDASLAGASHEVVQRYGDAVKQHIVAYTGVDNEIINPNTGASNVLKKSLKSIQAQKTNEKNEFSIHQQKAGWAAEVKDVAETNSERIISKNPTRKIRHDDLPNMAANHELFDHIEIDSQGGIFEGTGTQMKFIGSSEIDPKGINNAKRALEKLQGKKFQKYIDNDVPIEVPKDEYKQMIDEASLKIDKLTRQLDRVKSKGNAEEIAKLEKRIDDLKVLKKNLRPSKLTRKQSVEAVNAPKLSTAKSIGKDAHKAGVEQAKSGAAISAAISLVRNTVAYVQGEKTADEAAKDIVVDTGTGTIVSYANAFSGSVIKGTMQNSSSSLAKAVSKTNLPARLASTTLNVGRTMSDFIKGDIDGAECVEKLGQDGFAEIGSAMLGTMGASLGGGSAVMTIVGGLAGSALGYAAAVAVYQEVATALKDAKLAREERIIIEKECENAIELLLMYRNEMNELVDAYLLEHIDTFNMGFAEMDKAILENDIGGFIRGNNRIQRLLCHSVQFESEEEFDAMMASDEPFVL